MRDVSPPAAARTDRRASGLYVAAAGGVLELAGLMWDAMRHARDAGLAAREELFALTDPSHALLLLGIGAVAVGLSIELITLTLRHGRRRADGIIIATVLISLVAANAGVALGDAFGRPSDRQDHSSTHEATPNDPIGRQLAETLASKGLTATLDELARLASADPDVLRRAHDLAHKAGELAVVAQPDVSKVITNCREAFLYGCYHGALKAYFAAKRQTRPADVVGVCPSTIGALLYFQCLHGLGHGVLANLGYELFRALTYCDALGSVLDRRSCYGGVFMENIVVAIEQYEGRATGDRALARPYLRPDDAQYPCNVVAEKYRATCYQLQTSGMLLYNGRDFAKAALSCDMAPAAHVAICFESLGRDVSGEFLRDDARTIGTCGSLPSKGRVGCFVGAMKNLLDAPERVIPFCRQVPDESRPACYAAAGTQFSLNFPPGDPRRSSACAAAEPAYVKTCQDELDRR